jgi:hypothetical protein
MIDLCIQLIRGEQRPPALEDRVSHLQDTKIDFRVI